MNYNPFLYQMPTSMIPAATSVGSKGLLSSLFGGMNFGSIVTNAGKTLGVINQAIPVFKQVKPIVSNAKTMFKVMNEFKKTDVPVTTPSKENITKDNNIKTTEQTEIAKISDTSSEIDFSGKPVFFM